MASRIKRGDTVQVTTGEDRGRRGKVMRVIPKANRVVVSGVNIVKKHQRPVRAGRGEVQPGIIEFEAPLHLSNVMLVCPECGEPSRIGFVQLEDGAKARFCKKCGQTIE